MTRIPLVMPEHHDADTIQFFVKKQMEGKAFQIRAPPAAGIKVKPLGVLLDQVAGFFELFPKIVAQGIAD